MSFSNYDGNKKAIEAFRKELRSMFSDISEIDAKVLNKSVNIGLANVKRNTPVGKYSSEVDFITKDGQHVHFTVSSPGVGGFMRKSWRTTPIVKSIKGAEKSLVNTADYASYVNDGHRKVNQKGVTKGWVKGYFMLERAQHSVDLALVREFRKEVERVNKKHDK
jgi:hypothetical protein